MKISRIIATGAVVALLGGSSVVTAVTANAETDPGVNFVTAANFTNEVSPYAHSWFRGTATPASTTVDSAKGLIVGGQILNGETPTTGLLDLVDGASLGVSDGDQAWFQVPVFANPGDDFTTLRPVNPNNAGLQGDWITSRTLLNDDGSTAYAANATATLGEFNTALGDDYTILAYGAFALQADPAAIVSIRWNDVTTRFVPQATQTATPTATTIAVSALRTTGLSVRFTGFAPGESVQPGSGTEGSGGSYEGPIVAGPDGSITVNFILPDADPGTVFLTASALGIGAFAEITVTADGAAPATPISGNANFTG